MPWLPDTDGRAIRLDLIDVPALNPDVLRLLDGLLYDYGLGDNRLLKDNGLLNDSRCRYDCCGGLHNNGLPSLPVENSKIVFSPKPACVFRLRAS